MEKRKQTAGERIILGVANNLITRWGPLGIYSGFRMWQADTLSSHFRYYKRKIDREIAAAEKRGYERGRTEATK